MNLSDYFSGVGAKRLSAVEVDGVISHQHEFNGVKELRSVLGESKIESILTRYFYLSDDDEETSYAQGRSTWYDARESHATRTEYRLYYDSGIVLEKASPGDLLVIAKRKQEELFVLVASAGSTIEGQLIWLFGLDKNEITERVKAVTYEDEDELNYTSKAILDEIGIEVEEKDDKLETTLIEKFGGIFPSTLEFSDFARNMIEDVDPVGDPDTTLIRWLDQEEKHFKLLEKHIVGQKIQYGFEEVDDFISYSLSVQNTRKSRAGKAFENHLKSIFDFNDLRYSFNKKTENNKRPDFIFPDIDAYHDASCSADKLYMLGVKTTCKDRWRQILSEAERIERKHLITLEPSISENQTDEMRNSRIQLIIPGPIVETYTGDQQSWLISLERFISQVKQTYS